MKRRNNTADTPKSPLREIVQITLPLTVICVAVALMLAVVNALTANRIALAAEKEKQNAIELLFPTADGIVRLEGEDEVYLCAHDGVVLGCCVGVVESGFGGDIEMMVATDTSGAVVGVRILSMSETPGVGTKTRSDSFLSRFTGGDSFVIGENIDAISGATISSKAVVRGVNRAIDALPDLASVAGTLGWTVHETENVTENVTVSVVPPIPQEDTAETETAHGTVLDESPVLDVPAEVTFTPVNIAVIRPDYAIAAHSSAVNRVLVTDRVYDYTRSYETELVETEPIEPEPAEPEPVETEPIETEPVETEPIEPEPVETEPVEPEPIETEPAETETTEEEATA